MTSSDQQPITITATREQWQALVDIVPLDKMTYTKPGIDAFNAFRAIKKTLNPDSPDDTLQIN